MTNLLAKALNPIHVSQATDDGVNYKILRFKIYSNIYIGLYDLKATQ